MASNLDFSLFTLHFSLKNDHLFTHESENGEYGNEQSFQYQKEGLDLVLLYTQKQLRGLPMGSAV